MCQFLLVVRPSGTLFILDFDSMMPTMPQWYSTTVIYIYIYIHIYMLSWSLSRPTPIQFQFRDTSWNIKRQLFSKTRSSRKWDDDHGHMELVIRQTEKMVSNHLICMRQSSWLTSPLVASNMVWPFVICLLLLNTNGKWKFTTGVYSFSPLPCWRTEVFFYHKKRHSYMTLFSTNRRHFFGLWSTLHSCLVTLLFWKNLSHLVELHVCFWWRLHPRYATAYQYIKYFS